MYSLRTGNTKSCGCLRKEQIKEVHEINNEKHFKDGVYIPGLKNKLRTDNTTGQKEKRLNIKLKYGLKENQSI